MVLSWPLLSYIGCISSLCLPTPTLGLALPPEGKLLEARQSSFQTRIVDTGSMFSQEDNGVWQLIDATGDGILDLAYIKTKNTKSKSVEVHIASSSGFKTRVFGAGTTFAEENDGTWLLVPSKNSALPDLAFIKTSNTPSGRVEVHIASGASGYKSRIQQTATIFGNEDNGFWSLYDYDRDGILDLVYIKTRNTSSGKVEVHVASGASTYSRLIRQTVTSFAVDGNNGFWSLAPYSFPIEADLVYIKNTGTSTGQVEVSVLSRSSNFQTPIFQGASIYAQETNGVWSMIDYNRDGALDLAYIKYQNSVTGTTEVHVAAG
ncbi:hypothetical protein F5B22DRAFT_134325 [Xylaria bambusicola]|uniref:uncharacterized protein n=1 Tax=Xylaria bambusicola TaxID=326684 RepID=UPI00200803EB|nr:uncharacterized protein F5B22DRAFT_134325 [Xylaria bambusicola]KAI0517212.1 hypothetical protein F5B22DRAFT_134325 [Xylaria bambusicola]